MCSFFNRSLIQKPDEHWLDSNDIEVTAQGDTLKLKVREVGVAPTRVPGSPK